MSQIGAFFIFMADDKKTYAYNYLIKKGLTPAQASGVVGNLQAESGFDTKIKGTADNKKSEGIAQWHSERKQGLFDFAKKNNKDWGDLDLQLDYILHELNTTHKSALRSLQKANTPQEATIAFMNDYERPAEWAKKQSSKLRINTALEVAGQNPDPNFTYNPQQEQTEQQPFISIAELNTELPQTEGIVFETEPQAETKKEGVKMAQELNEQNFLKEIFDLQNQNLLQPEIEQQDLSQEFIEPVQVSPIEYNPIQMQDGGQIPISSDGVFASGNKPVIVPSDFISMEGVAYPILAKSLETGETKLLQPEEKYHFKNTKRVLEIPQFK